MDRRLLAIANSVILKNDRTPAIGLYNGKLGNALFLYHYNHLTGYESYRKFADDLIDRIYETVRNDKQLPNGFADGISGIGWGIGYLAKHHFVESGNIWGQMDYLLRKRWDIHKIMNMETAVWGDILYWWQRHSLNVDEGNSETYRQIDDLLIYYGQMISLAPENFPVAALNSLLYLMIQFQAQNMRIISKIEEIILKQIYSGEVPPADLETTLRFTQLRPDWFSAGIKEKIATVSGKKIIDSNDIPAYLEKSAWQNLLYFDNESTSMQKELAEQWLTPAYIGERLTGLKNDEVSLKGGLTALGMMILQTQG